MKYFKILFLMVVFSTMNVVAQKDNATKIVGCCTADGKYSTAKRGKEQTQITGTYQFEDDGKTLTQKSDRNNGGMDEDATIALLNEQELVFEIEIGKMYFVRKKD
jgi:hypothetical protein